MKTKLYALAALALFLCSIGQVEAGFITMTFDEVNGPAQTSGFPGPSTLVESENFVIPTNEQIVSATFSGIFGETSIYSADTAHHELFIDGFLVSDTDLVTPDPFNNVVPFSFTFTDAGLLSLLSDGVATLSYVQTSEFRVRLSETTLELTTAPVPEPASLALMACGGLGLVGGAIRRRRARKTAAV